MGGGTVHVVGAGLAGLAAAVSLACRGKHIVLHEAAAQAGGRCRSYHEPALDMLIDNGNHLLLSGNRDALAYAKMIGARDKLVGPTAAEFDFVDLASHENWRLRPNAGKLPWWVFDHNRRVPGTGAFDYLGLAKLLFAGKNASIADVMACNGLLYDRLWQPFLLAALNTDPPEASAALAGAVVRETLALGGDACRPLIAAEGLSVAFVDPALETLRKHGADIRLGSRLRALRFNGNRIAALDFAAGDIALDTADQVVLATPSWVASGLVPDLTVPTEMRSIINGHFKVDAPPGLPAMLGVIGGTVEWIFAFPGRLSITISGADRLLETPRQELADFLWRDVCAATGVAGPLPAWQVIKEKRATFASTPAENAKRPTAKTRWPNLILAGDYTATGLPATIEGAIRSGFRAAEIVRAASAMVTDAA